MITWALLRSRLLLVMDDLTAREPGSDTSPSWSDDELLSYIDDALTHFASHTPVKKVYSGKITESTSRIVIPDDVLSIGPVSLLTGSSRQTSRPMFINPGDTLDTTRTGRYYEWPRGTLNFLSTLTVGQPFEVMYFAYYERVTKDEDLLPVPRWAEEPIRWYMLSLAMAKPGLQASTLGQYKDRTAAGGPLDNPLLQFSAYCLQRYTEILAEHPPQDRTGWEAE